MAVKVVVDPTAQPTASKLVTSMNQLQTLVNQIATASQPLVEPTYWDGVGAAEFRALWPGHINTLKSTAAALATEAQEALKNISSIDTADSANQVR